MQKRRVRIYKADDENRTAQFLNKAQMGAQVQSIDKYFQYAYDQLTHDIDPEILMQKLIQSGLPQDTAYQVITTVMNKMVDAGEMDPEKRQETATDQPEQVQQEQTTGEAEANDQQALEAFYKANEDNAMAEEELSNDTSQLGYQEGGEALIGQYARENDYTNTPFDINGMIENTPGTQEELQSVPLEDYIPNYQSLGWDNIQVLPEQGLPQEALGGTPDKKTFVKNVMGLIKKDAGGDSVIGNKATITDNLTGDVNRKYNSFLNAIKDESAKVLTEELYDKFTAVQNQYAQMGGATGGVNPLTRFINGGDNIPYYEADFLPEAQVGGSRELSPEVIEYLKSQYTPIDNVTNPMSNSSVAKTETKKVNQDHISQEAIRKAKVNYLPINGGPGSTLRSLTPWNPIFAKQQYHTTPKHLSFKDRLAIVIGNKMVEHGLKKAHKEGYLQNGGPFNPYAAINPGAPGVNSNTAGYTPTQAFDIFGQQPKQKPAKANPFDFISTTGTGDYASTRNLGFPVHTSTIDNSEPITEEVQVKNKIRAVDPEAGVNVFNAGIRGLTGILNRRQQAKQERQMYDNLTSDNLYASQAPEFRGDWVDFGSQLGQYRFDQQGQDRSSYSAYGKLGGYMKSGGFVEGQEVEMSEEELADFIANGGEVDYL